MIIPIWWQPWTWRWSNLLLTDKEMEEDNALLRLLLTDADRLLRSVNDALAYNIQQKEAIRQEAINILAAITLQHNGQIVIKPDFLQLATSEHLNISREEDGTLTIKTQKNEPTTPEEPFIEDEE
jgi:hypothetical protein